MSEHCIEWEEIKTMEHEEDLEETECVGEMVHMYKAMLELHVLWMVNRNTSLCSIMGGNYRRRKRVPVRTVSVEITLALNCLAFGGRVAYVHTPPSDLPPCEAIHESLSLLPNCNKPKTQLQLLCPMQSPSSDPPHARGKAPNMHFTSNIHHTVTWANSPHHLRHSQISPLYF
jgi:hypothetical protein